MINVNITSLMLLTKLYLPGMVERRKGRILNVSSTASFLPGPLQAVYYASKTFVTSFSQTLAEELRSSGITVTALCPGPVDTGFFDNANMHGVKMLKSQKATSPAKTAEKGYRDMMKGKLLLFDNNLLRLSTGSCSITSTKMGIKNIEDDDGKIMTVHCCPPGQGKI